MFRSLQQNIQICSNRQLFCMPFQNLVSKNTFSLSLHILTFFCFLFFFDCNIKFINVPNILLFFWTRRWVSRNQICTKNMIPSLLLESTEFYYCTISLDTLCFFVHPYKYATKRFNVQSAYDEILYAQRELIYICKI